MVDVQFEQLSVSEGLSQSTAYCLYEDKLGFIWVGTDDGLNRYDGYGFLTFRNSPLDETSISNNSVNCITEDKDGSMWVGTDQGLNLMVSEKSEFIKYRFNLSDEESLSSNTVWCMSNDAQGNLWVGTANGLNRYDSSDSTFVRFKQEYNDSLSLSNNSINSLYTAKDGRLWIGTNQGLNRWDEVTQTFQRYEVPRNDLNNNQAIQCIAQDAEDRLIVGTEVGLFELVDDRLVKCERYKMRSKQIRAIETDSEGNLWIGTTQGLYQFVESRDRPYYYQLDDQNLGSISDNRIMSIHEDSNGIVWIGTFSGGVSVYYRDTQRIFHFNRSNLGRTAFPSDVVNSVAEIDQGAFWLGTNSGIGLLKRESSEEEVSIALPNFLKNTGVRKICRADSLIAIGTQREGLFIIRPGSTKIQHYAETAQGDGLSDDRVTDLILEYPYIWVGTQNGGVNRVDLRSDSIMHLKYDPSDREGLSDNRISALVLEGDKALWIGTSSSGVQRYDFKAKTFDSFSVSEDSVLSLSNNKVLSMHRLGETIWVGTKGGGLNRIEIGSRKTSLYTTDDGLANNVVHDIISDEKGRLWLSTNSGISVLDVENKNFINYNDVDGVGNQTFRPGSGLISSTGEILFGGLQGLDIIRYEEIESNSVLPKVYITKIDAFDSGSNEYDPDLSKELVHQLDRIDLPPRISLITLEFAGLNYRKPEKNRYAYRLAGITDEWTSIDDRRYVTFSELSPGEYSLQVKATNNDGKWSEDPTELIINVIPSFYQTKWFQALVILFLLLLIYMYYRWRVRRVTRRNKLLEERVKARTRQIEKERDEKAILLKEIHHRVKNNLQIVNSLLRLQSHYVKDEEALWALDESQNRVMSMAMIHERMYKTKNLANIDIRQYIKDLCTDIIYTYNLKNNVELNLDIQVDKLNLDTLTPLGLIINEISSNAMKYAFPDERDGTFTVTLHALEPGRRYKLVIGDDGVGLPTDLSDKENDSLGTTLIESLSEQLNGELKQVETKGTVYELTFEQINSAADSMTA